MEFGRQVVVAANPGPDSAQLDGRLVRFLAVVVTTVVCWLNIWSSSTSLWLNSFTASVKILLLIAVISAGGNYIAKHHDLTQTASDWNKTADEGKSDWSRAILLVLYSYFGWDNATQV